MEAHPKFIIEEDQDGKILIIGKAQYHRQLAHNAANVRGGGWWQFGDQNNSFILFGESFDFGRASLEDIRDCIKRGAVYSSYTQVRSFSNYKFQYRHITGEIEDIN